YGGSRLEPTGNHQRRLGQPIAWIKRLTSKPIRRKCSRKAIQRLRPHRLGTVPCHGPATEIQFRALLRGDFLDAQVIGEIGSAAARELPARDGTQPTDGLLKEVHRREK